MTDVPDASDDAESDALIAALRTIPPSGLKSFETLVRDLLSRETGRRFNLAKSGPQGGIDSRTSAGEPDTVIGVEVKRYGLKTPLGADETVKKLSDAATAHPDLELWILAASREVMEPDRSQLHAKGGSLGIEVQIFDWPQSAELLPLLLLLCARHADILSDYVTLTPAIEAVLEKARAHPTYPDQCATLAETLNRPTLSYSRARDAVARSVLNDMASRPSATARIGRYANLTDPDIIRIDRRALRTAIADWWTTAEPRPPLALLGSEGMGKTWAALGWWLDREASGTPLPLTLIVPARRIASSSPDEIIGSALHRMFDHRSPEWWARRARRWTTRTDGTRIVLIVDGLNERFDVDDWSLLAAELRTAQWAGAVDLLLTDRADHWRLHGLAFHAAGVGCAEIPIGLFDDSELDEILGRAGMDRPTDATLLRLMRVPRLCALAIRHWARLLGSGDITPERLVYEDFRDRLYPGLDDREMRNLISEVGQRLRTATEAEILVLRRDIAAALAAESGVPGSAETISAIVSGVWFAQVPGEPHQFRVDRDMAPLAMGLALAKAVQSFQSEADVRQKIEAFVDDLRGLQLGVTLVGIAASFAMISPDCSPVARKVLLDTWLGSDNFTDADLKRYTRLIAEDPAYFLERTETVWRDRERAYEDRNVHLGGIVNAAEIYPSVLDPFIARAAEWLSETFRWRDAMNDVDGPDDVSSPAVAARVDAWNAARETLPPILFVEPGEDYLPVAETLLAALSYLPRAPFAAALGNYAISAALTRSLHFHRDRLEWLLRANAIDPVAAQGAIIALAARIRAIADPHAGAAADILLEALSSLDPAAQPVGEPSIRHYGRETDARVDAGGMIHWDYDPGVRKRDWGAIALRHATDLAPYAVDPDSRLSEAALTLLRDAAKEMVENGASPEFDMVVPMRLVLARWAPDWLARYFRRVMGVGANPFQQNRSIKALGMSWIAHDDSTRAAIDASFQASKYLPVAGGNSQGPVLIADLVVLALADASQPQQFAAFRSMPAGPTWPKSKVSMLKPLTAADYVLLEEFLVPTADTKRLNGWLGFLAHTNLAEIPAGYAPVAALFGHEDTVVRTTAMRVASRAHDNGLCNILRDSGWTAPDGTGEEALYGSVALARADPVPDDNRVSDIHPMALGYLSRQWPEEARYVAAFIDHVRSRVSRELNPPRSTQGFAHTIQDGLSYDRLVADHPEMVESWIQPALEGARLDFGLMVFSADHATLELCRALLAANRPSGALLWRNLIAAMAHTNVKSDNLRLMIFDIPRNDVTTDLQREALDLLHLDSQLSDVAGAYRRRDDNAGLVALIEPMLERSTYDHARALILAGELDQDEAAERLWHERILPAALPRWLSGVRDLAQAHYLANIQAKHWLRTFVERQDAIAQFGAFELFAQTATRTSKCWADDMIEGARDRISPRAYGHWRINVPLINARLEEDRKPGKDTLGFTKVLKHDQSPWS